LPSPKSSTEKGATEDSSGSGQQKKPPATPGSSGRRQRHAGLGGGVGDVALNKAGPDKEAAARAPTRWWRHGTWGPGGVGLDNVDLCLRTTLAGSTTGGSRRWLDLWEREREREREGEEKH
jgi:hypothetical protein